MASLPERIEASPANAAAARANPVVGAGERSGSRGVLVMGEWYRVSANGAEIRVEFISSPTIGGGDPEAKSSPRAIPMRWPT